MRKLLLLTLLAVSSLFLGTACHTARDAAEDSAELGAHAVRKTGHVLEHGARKVENNL